MPQTELRPIAGACRHLRGRYKIEQRGRSPVPELELIRYECERKYPVETDEEIEKCMAARLRCWREVGEIEKEETLQEETSN
ncbi:MAG: hypothetical protein QME62_13010 [Armatimonadota bacterium]|nr:hypothetical protein [Armatimonadota bacterium]